LKFLIKIKYTKFFCRRQIKLIYRQPPILFPLVTNLPQAKVQKSLEIGKLLMFN